MSNLPDSVVLPISVENGEWKLFSYCWDSVEGNRYAGYFYAKDLYHATILLEDMKSTATIEGEMISG